jgi:hypothetical protein
MRWLSAMDVPCLDTPVSKVDGSQDPYASFAFNPLKTSFHTALRSNQLLRYLDDHIFEDFLSILDRIEIGKGQSERSINRIDAKTKDGSNPFNLAD